MFKKFAKFALIRAIAYPLGLGLYVYTAVNHSGQMRIAQRMAESLSNLIEDSLPDHYAVWIPNLNLETTLLAIGFIFTAFIVVELLLACCRGAYHATTK